MIYYCLLNHGVEPRLLIKNYVRRLKRLWYNCMLLQKGPDIRIEDNASFSLLISLWMPSFEVLGPKSCQHQMLPTSSYFMKIGTLRGSIYTVRCNGMDLKLKWDLERRVTRQESDLIFIFLNFTFNIMQ